MQRWEKVLNATAVMLMVTQHFYIMLTVHIVTFRVLDKNNTTVVDNNIYHCIEQELKVNIIAKFKTLFAQLTENLLFNVNLSTPLILPMCDTLVAVS